MIFGNVPQYPGYPSYWLLVNLITTLKWQHYFNLSKDDLFEYKSKSIRFTKASLNGRNSEREERLHIAVIVI